MSLDTPLPLLPLLPLVFAAAHPAATRAALCSCPCVITLLPRSPLSHHTSGCFLPSIFRFPSSPSHPSLVFSCSLRQHCATCNASGVFFRLSPRYPRFPLVKVTVGWNFWTLCCCRVTAQLRLHPGVKSRRRFQVDAKAIFTRRMAASTALQQQSPSTLVKPNLSSSFSLLLLYLRSSAPTGHCKQEKQSSKRVQCD